MAIENFEEKVAGCHQIIVDATKLLSNNPALMTYFSVCELKPVNNENLTMRLNVRGTGSTALIEYNPEWMLKVNEYSLVALCIYGEVLRIALHHCTTRKLNPITSFKTASDLIVFENFGILNSHKEEVREAAKMFPTFSMISKDFTAMGLTREKDWFLEKIFAFLNKKAQQEQQQQQQSDPNGMPFPSGGMGDGKKPDDKEGEEGEGKGDGDDGEGSESQGKGEGAGEDGDQESKENTSKGKPGKESEDALKKHFERTEKNAQMQTAEWDENTMLDENIEQITEHIASDTSMWGNMSGGLKQMILAANAPKFDPTSILRRFKQSIISAEHEDTRSKVNRRHGWVLPGERVTYKSRILFAEDVSGSMPDETVAKGMAMVNKFIKHCDIDYCAWDGQCGPISKIRKNKKEFDLVGRGCTNPQCVIDMLDEKKLQYDGIVFFTDAEFSWENPGRKWNRKVFMITTEDEPPEWVRFKIHMKDLENREF